MQKSKRAKKVLVPVKLNFKYCECGCKGFEAKNYWIYMLILDKGEDHPRAATPYLAVKGHKYGVELGWFKTYKQAIAVCEKEFKKDLLRLAAG